LATGNEKNMVKSWENEVEKVWYLLEGSPHEESNWFAFDTPVINGITSAISNGGTCLDVHHRSRRWLMTMVTSPNCGMFQATVCVGYCPLAKKMWNAHPSGTPGK